MSVSRPSRRVRLPKSEQQAFKGLHLFHLSPPRSGPFSALRLRIDPHSHFPCIYHRRTAEFFHVLKGRGFGRVGTRRVRFKAGDSVYLPPRTHHDFHTGALAMEALVIFSPRFDPKKPDVVRVYREGDTASK